MPGSAPLPPGAGLPPGPLTEAFGRGLLAVLEELVVLGALHLRGAPVRPPVVTLHLRSGRDLHGLLAAVESSRGGGHLIALRRSDPDPRLPPTDVAVLEATAIEAVTVHDPDRLDAPTGPEPVGRLELRRLGQELAEKLKAALGKTLQVTVQVSDGASDDERRALSELITRTRNVLTALSADELGKQALLDKVHTVELGLAAESTAQLAGGTLRVWMTPGVRGWMDQDLLRTQLEAVL